MSFVQNVFPDDYVCHSCISDAIIKHWSIKHFKKVLNSTRETQVYELMTLSNRYCSV